MFKLKFIFLRFFLKRKIFFILLLFYFLASNESIILKAKDTDYRLEKYQKQLGRDRDPKIKSDIGPISLWFRKLAWETLTFPGLRNLTGLYYPSSTISFMDGKKSVAFTIDDGFCGLDNPDGCMVEEVRALFKEFNANATFFISGSHCKYTSKSEVARLIADGHELANHNMMDWPYTDYLKIDFEKDLLETEKILAKYIETPSLWYRAPFGRINETMQNVLNEKGYINVMTDSFAHDTAIPDPEWIAKYILDRARPGSIILIHMPERGLREWNYQAMRLTLQGLSKQGLKIVTLTDLYNEK